MPSTLDKAGLRGHVLKLQACHVATPQAPRSSQMVQNRHTLVQTRPRRPWGVVNKTQPKAPLPARRFWDEIWAMGRQLAPLPPEIEDK